MLQPPQRRSRRKVRAPKYRQSDGEENEGADDDGSETEIDEQVRVQSMHAQLLFRTFKQQSFFR